MEPFTLMAIIVVGAKAGLSVLTVVGVASGMNWLNKKTFSNKKGGAQHESDINSEKFSRKDL